MWSYTGLRFNVHFNVRAVWCKELFARLGGDAGVNGRENDIANWDLATALLLLDLRREVVLLNMTRRLPRREEAHLAKVSVIGEVQLRAEAKNLAVKDDGASIISAVAVEEGQADINHDAVEGLIRQDRIERIPRVVVDLILKKVVETAIASNLQLGSDAQRCSLLLGLMDTLFDPPEISFKV